MLNENQLQAHYNSIGGSFAAAIMGYSKYTSPLDVYLLLTDEEFRRKNQEDVSKKLQVKLGNHLESFIADEIAAMMDWELEIIDETIHHPEYDFLTAHPDRIILLHTQENIGLEIKARSAYKEKDYGDEGTDHVLEEEMAQCQHYMNVTGLKMWRLAVLIGNQEIKQFEIPRNDDFIECMQAEQIRFWHEHVLAKKPPEPRTAEEAAKLYPQQIFGSTVIATPEIQIAVAEANSQSEIMKLAEKEWKKAKDKIACYMRDNETLLDSCGNALLTYKAQKREGYSVAPTEFKTMRFK